MPLKRRTQVGTEFLVVFMFIFLFFVIFNIGSNHYRLDIISKEKHFLSRDLALWIHGEIYAAYQAKEGYERNFTLPDKLKGTSLYEYNATVRNNTLIVLTDSSEVDFPVPVGQANITIGGANVIRNVGGVVSLNG